MAYNLFVKTSNDRLREFIYTDRGHSLSDGLMLCPQLSSDECIQTSEYLELSFS